MHTQTELLDIAKAQSALPSDYALAKAMQVSKQAMSHYRNTHRIMEDRHALALAELARLPAGYVLACLHSESANCTPCRDAWTTAAEVLGKGCKSLKGQGKRAA